MKLPLSYPGRCAINAAALITLALSATPFFLSAATGDSKPVLLSTTGGKGGGWANMAELKKAAEAHNPTACAQYGDVLLRGDGVKQDTARAIMFLREAAKLGEVNAIFRLGKIYDDGEFAPQDYDKAFEYYGISAKAGVAEAQYNLGVLYATGRGTKQDYVEGLAWLIVATKNGANGDGEQKTREQLTKIKRQKLIASAEQRAAEILKNPAAAVTGATSLPSEVAEPKKTQVPAKVDLGGAPAPEKIPVAPTTTPLPAFGPSLPLPPPHIETPTPTSPQGSTDKNSTSQK